MSARRSAIEWIVLTGLIALVISMCSCSASWHLRRAKAKEPSLFQDTTRSISSVNLGASEIEAPELNNCFNKKIEWVIPREYEVKGEKVKDSIKLKYIPSRLSSEDSIQIHAALEVECDPVVVTEQLPPIILEPTLWQKLQWMIYAVGVFCIILFVRRIVRN